MRLCFGTFAKILNFCKPDKRNPTQNELLNAMLSSVYAPYISAGIQDTDSTHLINCEQAISPEVSKVARELIAGDELTTAVAQFNKKVIQPNYIKTDKETMSVIILALFDIIERDEVITGDAVVDIVNGTTKKALHEQQSDFVSFLTGIFLYTITAVSNKQTDNVNKNDTAEVKSINVAYIEKFISIVRAQQSFEDDEPAKTEEGEPLPKLVDDFFETTTKTSLKTVDDLLNKVNFNSFVAPSNIKITNVNGDNYEKGAINRSLGRNNTFNAPIYMGYNADKKGDS